MTIKPDTLLKVIVALFATIISLAAWEFRQLEASNTKQWEVISRLQGEIIVLKTRMKLQEEERP